MLIEAINLTSIKQIQLVINRSPPLALRGIDQETLVTFIQWEIEEYGSLRLIHLRSTTSQFESLSYFSERYFHQSKVTIIS